MNSLNESLDSRARLAGSNHFELLLFYLGGRQAFGINVFKIREVMPCPAFTSVPKAHPHVVGLVHLRGQTMMVIDLAQAIGLAPLREREEKMLVVAEYNGRVQGLLASGVDRIVNLEWGAMRVPPKHSGGGRYLTAVTTVDGVMVEILDIERVLGEVLQPALDARIDAVERPQGEPLRGQIVLVVDDSAMARRQVSRTFAGTGAEVIGAENGLQALELVQGWIRDGDERARRLSLVVSDIEMPGMDGYALTCRLREEPGFGAKPIILHSSLSGEFNTRLVEQVGADCLITKYCPEKLLAEAQRLARPG